MIESEFNCNTISHCKRLTSIETAAMTNLYYGITWRETVPQGLISVIPQDCANSTPYVSKYQRIISLGGELPPSIKKFIRMCLAKVYKGLKSDAKIS
jgi:hypothetical protein